jgi:TPR repeat protein
MKRGIVGLGVAAALLVACGGVNLELGAPTQGPLPEVRHHGVALVDETSDNPCKRNDLAGCIDRCQEGDTHSCNAVGVMFEFGRSEPDGTLASGFYSRACDAGYAPGCTNLAWLYSLGRGVPRDAQQAMNLFTRAYDSSRLACRRGDGSGCMLAGELLLQGRVEPTDDGDALAFFQRACEAGESQGCAYVSQLE